MIKFLKELGALVLGMLIIATIMLAGVEQQIW